MSILIKRDPFDSARCLWIDERYAPRRGDPLRQVEANCLRLCERLAAADASAYGPDAVSARALAVDITRELESLRAQVPHETRTIEIEVPLAFATALGLRTARLPVDQWVHEFPDDTKR